MTGTRAFRSVLVSVIVLVLLRAVPAYPWHGSGSITALAIDPVTPTTLYAGTYDRGVFKSTDGGASWSATGLTNILVTALAIDPQTPGTVYAGTEGGGAFKTADGGGNWIAINSGLTELNVADLAIDSQTPATLYAVTPGAWVSPGEVSPGGVFKSTDGGATWNAVLRNESFFYQTAIVQDLAIDPQNPAVLYTSVLYYTFVDAWGEVLKSTDGGASWNSTALNTWNVPGDLAIAPQTSQTPTTVYAGSLYYGTAFKSIDGGASWSELTITPFYLEVHDLAIDPVTPATLYAVIPYDGVFKSTDGGATWSAANTGLTDTLQAFGFNLNLRDLAIDPLNPTTLYLGTVAGVFKSTDGAATWSPTGLIQHSPLTSLSLSPTGVTGGTASTGTVNLMTAAPAGGVTVALATGDPAVATVPASVTVPAGATSATFTVSTSPVTANTGVTISATFDDLTKPAVLSVYAPAALVYLSLPGVTGGIPSTGTIHLSAPAPAGGAAIELSSSNPALATVPPSVTVPAGASYTYFAIASNPVPVSTSVTITASYGGVTKSAVLTVTPPRLSSLSLNPTSVTGGSASTGTVTLNAAAAEGGVTVMLRSDNTYVARVPASVTVPAGATSASFTVSTSPVANSIGFEISGTYGGLTPSARLTVTPATTATLYSLTLNDTSLPSGAPLAGTVSLTAPAPTGGAMVTLSSSNPAVATVPDSVTVPVGAWSASFTGSTAACIPAVVTISGTYEGVIRSAALTITSPTTTDTVAIQRADYFERRQDLRVAATSTSSTTTLQVFVTSTGDPIGTLTKGGDGTYRGQFIWPVNPQNITIRSSVCGSAMSAVKVK